MLDSNSQRIHMSPLKQQYVRKYTQPPYQMNTLDLKLHKQYVEFAIDFAAAKKQKQNVCICFHAHETEKGFACKSFPHYPTPTPQNMRSCWRPTNKSSRIILQQRSFVTDLTRALQLYQLIFFPFSGLSRSRPHLALRDHVSDMCASKHFRSPVKHAFISTPPPPPPVHLTHTGRLI